MIANQRDTLTADEGKHSTPVPGLFLLVGKSRTGRWIVRVGVGAGRKDVTLGKLADLTYDMAVSRASAMRAGELAPTPVHLHQRAITPGIVVGRTFRVAAEEFLTVASPRWKAGGKSLDQWRSSLDLHVYPVMGDVLVDKITPKHIEAVLSPIWSVKAETASRVRARIEEILARETAFGNRDATAPANKKIVEHLMGSKHVGVKGRVASAKAKEQGRRGGHPAPSVEALADYMLSAWHVGSMSHRAMLFTAYTVARENTVLTARWEDFDFNAKLWSAPDDRMKSQVGFVTPLAREVIALLTDKPYRREGLVFPGTTGRPLSNMTMDQSIRRHIAKTEGKHWTPHGVRTTFNTWARGQGKWTVELVDRCLSHEISDSKVAMSYIEGDPTVELRRPIMEAWAAHLMGLMNEMALA